MSKFVAILLVGAEIMVLGNLDRISRAIAKLEYEKAHELIVKANDKEANNPGVLYFSAVLFSIEDYQRFDLDTARMLANSSLSALRSVDEKTRADLAEDGVSEEGLTSVMNDIRDRIHKNLMSDLSIEEAEQFMRNYPESPYQGTLIFKRDSIVFERVKKNDQLGMYERFLERYETTDFREVAIKRIDELRYEVLVYSGKLADYYQFLQDHPKTLFRDEIEQFIFKVANAPHTSEGYIDFLALATNKKLRKKALDILYFLDPEVGYAKHYAKDSLDQIEKTRPLKLIPTMEAGKFGFHTSAGALLVPYLFENVEPDDKCSYTSDDWLVVTFGTAKQIVSKRGEVLIDNISDYSDLGSGIAKVQRGSNWYLYHKSGFRILEEPIQEAEVLEARWIKVKRNDKWELVSVSGHQLTSYGFSDIRQLGTFWLFERSGLLAVSNENTIEQAIGGSGLDLEFKFEDVELVSDEMLIGFKGDRECMLNSELEFLVPWGAYEINPDDSGWYLKTNEGYRLYDHSEMDIMNQTHPYLEQNGGWLALKTSEDWMLFPRGNQALQPSRGYDSLKLINRFCVYTKKEGEETLVFSNGIRKDLQTDEQVVRTFVDQLDYVLIDGASKILFDSAGRELLDGTYSEISFFNDSLLNVELKGKHGLLHLNGELMIEIAYDALDESNGLILCLKGGTIGCIDLHNGSVISAISDARIEKIGRHYLVKNDGLYGLLDSLETDVLGYSYDEIRFWNDTSYLVRNGQSWQFVNEKEETIGEPVEFLTRLVDTIDGAVYKFVSDGKYGLLSSRKGRLLDPEFTDIFNIGSGEDPIFFADQHLDKAGFHVVSYVNRSGDLLFSKAYGKEDFEKILCDD